MGMITKTNQKIYSTYKSGLLFPIIKTGFKARYTNGGDFIKALLYIPVAPIVFALASVAAIIACINYLTMAAVQHAKSKPESAAESLETARYCFIDSIALPLITVISPLWYTAQLISRLAFSSGPVPEQETAFTPDDQMADIAREALQNFM